MIKFIKLVSSNVALILIFEGNTNVKLMVKFYDTKIKQLKKKFLFMKI